jgi:hypothetical protein
MTKALPFTQLALRRAIKAAQQEGLRVVGIRPDGTVLVDDGEGDRPFVASPNATPSKWEDAKQ